MREWLRYERMAAAERRLIAKRRGRGPAPRARGRRRGAVGPRWLVTLDLLLGALVLAGKTSPLVWAALALALMLLLAVVVSAIVFLWKWLLLAALIYLAVRILRRYLAYRRAISEIPF